MRTSLSVMSVMAMCGVLLSTPVSAQVLPPWPQPLPDLPVVRTSGPGVGIPALTELTTLGGGAHFSTSPPIGGCVMDYGCSPPPPPPPPPSPWESLGDTQVESGLVLAASSMDALRASKAPRWWPNRPRGTNYEGVAAGSVVGTPGPGVGIPALTELTTLGGGAHFSTSPPIGGCVMDYGCSPPPPPPPPPSPWESLGDTQVESGLVLAASSMDAWRASRAPTWWVNRSRGRN